MVNKILNISLVTNIIKKLDLYANSFFIYKRYSDKTKCMYFMIKDEKMFDKYITIWEKVSNVIKKEDNSGR